MNESAGIPLDVDVETDLVPLALIAVETDRTVGDLAHRFRGDVVLDDLGMRCLPAGVARRFLADLADWRTRQVADLKRRSENAAKRPRFKGVPNWDGLNPVENLMTADKAAGTYSTPADDFGRGWGSPSQDLLEDKLAEGRRVRAEKKRLAELRRNAKERKTAAGNGEPE